MPLDPAGALLAHCRSRFVISRPQMGLPARPLTNARKVSSGSDPSCSQRTTRTMAAATVLGELALGLASRSRTPVSSLWALDGLTRHPRLSGLSALAAHDGIAMGTQACVGPETDPPLRDREPERRVCGAQVRERTRAQGFASHGFADLQA